VDVERAERESILRQGVTLPETPRERRQRESLAADLEGSPVVGRPLPLRLRNFRPAADAYLASIGGPLPYMIRLRQIDEGIAAAEAELARAWHEAAAASEGDPARFRALWRARASAWRFDELNDLIRRHNAYYPAESRLPMDPKTRDFVLVNGRDYRKRPLDASWVLERFPAELSAAAA
jgi:hypothetical protein